MQLAFISYSHRNKVFLEELREFLEPMLRNTSCEIWVDEDRIKVGEQWRQEIETAIENASVGVLIVTRDFMNSPFIQNEELPRLMQAADEGRLRIAWIHYEEAPYTAAGLSKRQAVHRVDPPLMRGPRSERLKRVTKICEKIHALLDDESQTVTRRPKDDKAIRVFRSQFPKTSGNLLGRDPVLKQLDEAWDDPAKNILGIIAPGGVGKSALVDRWFSQLAADNLRGAKRAFLWSFLFHCKQIVTSS